MDDMRSSYTAEQLSDLMASQRRNAAERILGYAFFGSLVAAVPAGLFAERMDTLAVFLSTTTVILCSIVLGVVTSD